MSVVLDLIIHAVSLVFLSIIGLVTAVAIPGLFLAAAAPWLDWILPVGKKRS